MKEIITIGIIIFALVATLVPYITVDPLFAGVMITWLIVAFIGVVITVCEGHN